MILGLSLPTEPARLLSYKEECGRSSLMSTLGYLFGTSEDDQAERGMRSLSISPLCGYFPSVKM
jgi:hypothetical protein